MTQAPINLIYVGVLGIIAFLIVRSIATNVCSNVTGWSTTEQVLVCEIIGIVVATAIILMLFATMRSVAGK